MGEKSGVILDRFKELVDTKTREEIASAIGCDTSLVTKHYSGDRTITLDYAIKYAKFFDVSVDYLVGLSSVSSFDSNIKSVCEYTGLNSKTVSLLNYMTSQKNDELDSLILFLDDFLSSDCFWSLTDNYTNCRYNLLNAISLFENALDTTNKITFGEIVEEAETKKGLSELALNKSVKAFERIVKKYFDLEEYYNDYNSAKETAETFGFSQGYNSKTLPNAEQAIDRILNKKSTVVNSAALHDIKKDFENIINEAIHFVENYNGTEDTENTIE